MTDLPALDDLMAKFRERMLAESTDAPDAIDAKVAEVREAIASQQQRMGVLSDSMEQLGQELEQQKQAKALTSPKGLRRLFLGLR